MCVAKPVAVELRCHATALILFALSLPHNNLFAITLLLPQKNGLTSMAHLYWQMGTKRPVTKDQKGGKATRRGHVIHTQKILSALGARSVLRGQKEIYLKFLSGHSRSPFKCYRIYSPSHLLCCCGFVFSILLAFLEFLSYFHFRFRGEFFQLTLFFRSSLPAITLLVCLFLCP